MFTSIVVGIDGSDAAERALRMACGIAKQFDAALHIVHTPRDETVAYAADAFQDSMSDLMQPSRRCCVKRQKSCVSRRCASPRKRAYKVLQAMSAMVTLPVMCWTVQKR